MPHYAIFLPVEPLAEYVRADSPAHLADMIGVGKETVSRWYKRGLPLRQADPLAIKVGAHPAMLWGQAWSDAEDQRIELLAKSKTKKRAA